MIYARMLYAIKRRICCIACKSSDICAVIVEEVAEVRLESHRRHTLCGWIISLCRRLFGCFAAKSRSNDCSIPAYMDTYTKTRNFCSAYILSERARVLSFALSFGVLCSDSNFSNLDAHFASVKRDSQL